MRLRRRSAHRSVSTEACRVAERHRPRSMIPGTGGRVAVPPVRSAARDDLHDRPSEAR